MKSLKQIFEESGTDKAAHKYDVTYEKFLEPFRGRRPFKLLEIGVAEGASIRAWSEYFDDPEIHCVDCYVKQVPEQVKFYRGDSGDPKFLEKVLQESGGGFDLVIDDGGHSMREQQVALRMLWPAVMAGGLYVVEDIQTSYLGGGYNAGQWPSTIAILLDMVERAIRDRNIVHPMFCFHNQACFIWKPKEIDQDALYPEDS